MGRDLAAGAKRKAPSPPSGQCHGAAPVAHALADATRIGATFATARRDQFPLPVFAFTRQHDTEDAEALVLQPPVRASDAQKIKARGVVTQRQGDTPVAWEVAGAALEPQNPKWQAFINARVADKRTRLGIASTATVSVELRSILLAERGARLVEKPRTGGTRREGVFATLVVVLPGTFTGGDVEVRDFLPHLGELDDDGGDLFENDEEISEEYRLVWRPCDEQAHGAFNLVWGVFHNCCEMDAHPVESGAGLCLVYDLVTTTPRQIRLYYGVKAAQRSVVEELSAYLNVAPSELTERSKISDDAWRTIHAFAADRPFVYLVNVGDFNRMYHEQNRVTESLADFCAQSRGEFVLYLANVLCTKRDRKPSSNSDRDATAAVDAGSDSLRVTLTAPWIKYGKPAKKWSYPPIFLGDYRHDVAPMGRVESFRYDELTIERRNDLQKDVVQKLYGTTSGVTACSTYALVVMSASVERRQIAKLPIEDAITLLDSLLSESQTKALAYAQRIVRYRREWTIAYHDIELFRLFVFFCTFVNDRQLFEKLLLLVHFKCNDDNGSLWIGIKHFGFDACFATIKKRICSTPTFLGRVYLVLALIDKSLDSTCVCRLLDVLLSVPPWTRNETQTRKSKTNDTPSPHAMETLLEYAYQLSPQKAFQVAAVACPEVLLKSVLPALIPRRKSDELRMRDVLVHAYEHLKLMMPEIRNWSFSKMHLPKHCAVCDELQLFLTSTATERTLECADEEECHHVRSVLGRSSREGASFRFHNDNGLSVRVVKVVDESFSIQGPTQLYHRARRLKKRVLWTLDPSLPDPGYDLWIWLW